MSLARPRKPPAENFGAGELAAILALFLIDVYRTRDLNCPLTAR